MCLVLYFGSERPIEVQAIATAFGDVGLVADVRPDVHAVIGTAHSVRVTTEWDGCCCSALDDFKAYFDPGEPDDVDQDRKHTAMLAALARLIESLAQLRGTRLVALWDGGTLLPAKLMPPLDVTPLDVSVISNETMAFSLIYPLRTA
ncbi:MAG TPA: hypothetical protein PK264_22295 [Hyphomicrobiaceae bacterium]|nr:hypothetical protein [Hyphomicrobiaceae bacterium]